MTPHELNLHIAEFVERSKQQGEESLVQAYLTAYWQRVKKMPSLKEIIKEPKKEQTDRQMLEKVKQLNTMFGGTSG